MCVCSRVPIFLSLSLLNSVPLHNPEAWCCVLVLIYSILVRETFLSLLSSLLPMVPREEREFSKCQNSVNADV